ncbi:ABC-F family ATP-binding cassette domain-containing protein [Cyclobacterium plantarum]|uniref:ABC-F family ATP-binding cassette domain-containing protein n=1 Tax=Cyclobacterium plantarum TaxID=2716263 RepID=A0ABX0HFF5_9BACT|nr:ABC-F family ATP-binding cassette domain-containing protein [Cyclobacterium plantarum]NHE59111.1 ABC-F family ATP-binding cassette domain-containing protein [Cyclobacterium plantarum]
MNHLSVENLSKSFGERVLFSRISFGIDQGQKTALVGINGAGKSTLMKIIMGEEIPDEGQVVINLEARIAYVHQNPVFSGEKSIYQTIFDDPDNETIQVIQAYQKALLQAEKDGNNDKLQPLFEKMDQLQAWDFEYQINEVLGKLGLHDTGIQVSALSGGQRKRVALAKAILNFPDLLLLDEPTNHLDLETIEWLEEYLSKANLSLLMVTHDRYFLDKVTNQILELEQGNLYRYAGNYGYFLEKKADRKAAQATEQEKAKSLYKKELDWIRRQPKARGTKAKYRVDAFEETKEKAFNKSEERDISLEVTAQRLGKKIVEIEKIHKSYGDLNLINDFSYVFKKGDKIGIIGPNGAGKTTFLNMLTGMISPDKGTVTIGQTTAFGYYRQEEDSFDETKRLIDIVKEVAEVVTVAGGSTITVSQFLNQFGFPPKQQHTPVSKLSGGERRRLQLLMVLVKSPNFLILDEPTNDLDIVTLNTLEDFLDNFPGCLVIVSHDRYFMDRLVEHLFVFDGEGKISDFPGNYTDYRENLKRIKPNPPKKTEEKKSGNSKDQDKNTNKASFKDKKEFETISQDLENLARKKESYINKINEGTENHQTLIEWSMEIESIEKKTADLEMRWLELSELDGIS